MLVRGLLIIFIIGGVDDKIMPAECFFLNYTCWSEMLVSLFSISVTTGVEIKDQSHNMAKHWQMCRV